MNVQDPIADMLTRIRNAIQARHRTVSISFSKQNAHIAKVLAESGYILSFSQVKDLEGRPCFVINLKYQGGQSVIKHLKRISKPSLRVYKSCQQLAKKMSGGLGAQIVSTPKGIMLDREARRERVGGEVLCEII
ncbi:MAG: 30S ribosomal protein S8 [Gammaproteobacteria bacterium]|nr:30S ribosomal protein S8 [Gammaproteobacteria bacterium]